MEQLTFLQESKEEKLEREVAALREQCEKVRKGQFAKISALSKSINELQFQFETIITSIIKTSIQDR